MLQGIIDATEISCESPSDKLNNSMTFSAYKHRNTLKAIVCISPGGSVTFVSDLFTGAISDLEIVKRSGLLDLF